MPATSTNFADLLDPRFEKIFDDTLAQLSSMRGQLIPTVSNNGRDTMRWSAVGAFGDWTEFAGSVNYDDVYQGYDVVMTPLEFTSGFQVERKLFDDDQYNIMDNKPRGMAVALNRTEESHAARLFNNAFTNDSYFYVNSEAVALCSNSHTTTSGASTASGFDNLVTTAFSATALTAVRNQMVGFRDDRANFMQVVPDEIWIPPDLYDVVYEVVASMGKVDTNQNNRNVHEGAYDIYEWRYMTDTNNWFVCDSALRKMSLGWVDRIPVEFAYVEDFDTLVGKWRGYKRHAWARWEWRFINGAQVS